MRNPVAPILDARGYIVLDGGLATELERHGEDLDDPLWSARVLLEDPDLIEEVHLDYLRAGADVATSASYQATFAGLEARGLDPERAESVLRLSVTIAKRACARHGSGLTAASIGCYGAYLHDGSEYTGDYGLGREELVDFHRDRFRALAAAEPDLVAFETIPSLIEAEALVDLLAEQPDVPAWISFSCRSEREVSHGERIEDCIAAASSSPSVVAVGFNCTPPRYINGLLERSVLVTDVPLAVYPNSGEAWDGAQQTWTGRRSADALEQYVGRWRDLGARLVGGCCRTDPATIAAIARTLGSTEDVVAEDAP